MEVFDHGGHTGVRMVVVVYVAGSTALDFSIASTRYLLCQGDHTVEVAIF